MTPEKTIEQMTEAQKAAMLGNPENAALMGGFCGLCYDAPHLVEATGINHPIFGSHYQLTDAGKAVRALLEGTTND